MLKASKAAFAVVVLSVIAGLGQQAASPKPQDRITLGENEVKQLLPLMDADSNGKVSKQEFMRFMEAEFERLDKEKTGQLDVKALVPPKEKATQFAKTGK
jgi:hypothetical protein